MTTRLPIGDPFPSIGVPALRPDGSELAAGTDRVVVFWDLDIDHWEQASCTVAGRNLTRVEWRIDFPNSGVYHVTCPQWPPGT
jgi:hypothetical protein